MSSKDYYTMKVSELIGICKQRGLVFSKKKKEELIETIRNKDEEDKRKNMNYKYICFIDIETNGLPKTKSFHEYYEPSDLEKYESSRIIEIAYILVEIDGNRIINKKEYNTLIRPDNFKIENTNIHGITYEDCIKEGITFSSFIEEFSKDMDKIDIFVAHNLLFDFNILQSESYRYKKDFYDILKTKKGICTMSLGKEIMKQRKSPKLVELYEFLFQKKFSQVHRALDDTSKCMECYCKIKNIN